MDKAGNGWFQRPQFVCRISEGFILTEKILCLSFFIPTHVKKLGFHKYRNNMKGRTILFQINAYILLFDMGNYKMASCMQLKICRNDFNSSLLIRFLNVCFYNLQQNRRKGSVVQNYNKVDTNHEKASVVSSIKNIHFYVPTYLETNLKQIMGITRRLLLSSLTCTNRLNFNSQQIIIYRVLVLLVLQFSEIGYKNRHTSEKLRESWILV